MLPYTWAQNAMGGITITRLSDKQARHLFDKQLLNRFYEKLEHIAEEADKGPQSASRATCKAMAEYFEE